MPPWGKSKTMGDLFWKTPPVAAWHLKKEKHMDGVIAWEKILVPFAAALAMGLSAWATAWAQAKIGAAGAGALAEKPELTATIIILVAIPETMVILGFVIAAMILLK